MCDKNLQRQPGTGIRIVVDGSHSPNRADDLNPMSMKRRVQEKNRKRNGPAPLLKFGGPGTHGPRLDPRRHKSIAAPQRFERSSKPSDRGCIFRLDNQLPEADDRAKSSIDRERRAISRFGERRVLRRDTSKSPDSVPCRVIPAALCGDCAFPCCRCGHEICCLSSDMTRSENEA
jgi:hypothetical protein